MKISIGLAAVLCLLQLLPLCHAPGNEDGLPIFHHADGNPELDDVHPSKWMLDPGSRSRSISRSRTEKYRSSHPVEGFEYDRAYPGHGRMQSRPQQDAFFQQGVPFGGDPRYASHAAPQGVGHGYSGHSTSHEPYGQIGVEQRPNMYSMRSMHAVLDQQGGRNAIPSNVDYHDRRQDHYGGPPTLRSINVNRNPREAFASMTQPHRGEYGRRKLAASTIGSAQQYAELDTGRMAQRLPEATASLRYQTQLDGTLGHRSGRSRNKGKQQLTEPPQEANWGYQNARQEHGTNPIMGRPQNVGTDHDLVLRLGSAPQAHPGAAPIEAEPDLTGLKLLTFDEALAQGEQSDGSPSKEDVMQMAQMLEDAMKQHMLTYDKKNWAWAAPSNAHDATVWRLDALQTIVNHLKINKEIQTLGQSRGLLPYTFLVEDWEKRRISALNNLKGLVELYNSAMRVAVAYHTYSTGVRPENLNALTGTLFRKLGGALRDSQAVLRPA